VEWGFQSIFIQGLRVLYLLNLKEGKRTKNVKKILACARNGKRFKRIRRRIQPPSLYELWRGKGDNRQETEENHME
jgi:hypothetical protein